MESSSYRPSILHRPLRSGGQATKETADAQWEREQEALRRRAAVQQEHLDRLTQSLYPTEQSKAAAAAEAQRQLQAHQAARLQAQMHERRLEEEQERAWADPTRRIISPAKDEPWLKPSMTYSSAQEERAARRRYEEEVGAANLAAARERAYTKQQQKAQEEEAARRLLAEESTFWNLGASNERWLPPERRLHSPRKPATTTEAHPPVWKWASDDAAKTYVPSRTGGIGCRSPDKDQARPKTPWALDEEVNAASSAAADAAVQQAQQRYQSRPASATVTGPQAMPWATELDPAPRPPQPYGRKHVQYLPRQLEGFGARVDRGFPF